MKLSKIAKTCSLSSVHDLISIISPVKFVLNTVQASHVRTDTELAPSIK